MNDHYFNPTAVESELSSVGVYASVTKGASMRPLFKTNRDMVIIKKIDAKPRKYDVVLYRNNSGKYVLHRVVSVKGDTLLIRGDNTFITERVSAERIIGALAEFNRKGKRGAVTDRSYRLYSSVWCFIYPLRYLFNSLFSILYRVYRAVFKRKKNNR